jgi:PTH2 family peptidyl-tRNA hydrolase
MKQVILVRMDLKMEKGKLATQVAHASVDAVLKTSKDKVNAWCSEGMKKVVLKVSGLKELLEYKKKADALKLKTALITDAGKTFFDKPTTTCLAIGPDNEDKIDKISGMLKIL